MSLYWRNFYICLKVLIHTYVHSFTFPKFSIVIRRENRGWKGSTLGCSLWLTMIVVVVSWGVRWCCGVWWISLLTPLTRTLLQGFVRIKPTVQPRDGSPPAPLQPQIRRPTSLVLVGFPVVTWVRSETRVVLGEKGVFLWSRGRGPGGVPPIHEPLGYPRSRLGLMKSGTLGRLKPLYKFTFIQGQMMVIITLSPVLVLLVSVISDLTFEVLPALKNGQNNWRYRVHDTRTVTWLTTIW